MDLLIFDFDGLILDTESADFQATSELYASHGVELPLELWARNVGTQNGHFDVYGYLEERSGKALDHAKVRQERHRRVLELLEPMPPRPGVVEYFEEARRQKITLALASSSPQDWVMGHLARLDLSHWFHSIRTANDVENVKPHPELYELTLMFMGVRPERAMAFEDSPNGIAAARAAGVYCVAVPNSVTRNLPLDHANHRIESMAEVSLRELLYQKQLGKI
ncbi:MAG TPA: HAD family hydrolase [bacterium]|nr:HAD family hydrolase [bacterium]